MRITVHERKTVGQLRDDVQRRYGSPGALRRYVKENPHDKMARVALHDLEEYASDRRNKVIQETRDVFIPDAAIGRLTVQRLQLLLAVKGMPAAAPSARALARALDRDIKNVSEDIRALREIGLLEVEAGGRGKPNRITLPGDRIDLHLIEARR